MKHPESAIIFNRIKQSSNLNDEALSLLGITKDKIDTAMVQCIKAGLSKKKAMDTIFNLWKNSEETK